MVLAKYKFQGYGYSIYYGEKMSWMKCLFCNGDIEQIREAFFKCKKCNMEFIACEEDMKTKP